MGVGSGGKGEMGGCGEQGSDGGGEGEGGAGWGASERWGGGAGVAANMTEARAAPLRLSGGWI